MEEVQFQKVPHFLVVVQTSDGEIGIILETQAGIRISVLFDIHPEVVLLKLESKEATSEGVSKGHSLGTTIFFKPVCRFTL